MKQILLALSLCLLATTASAAKGEDALLGLWKSRLWLGPTARGPLMIGRSGEGYTADMMGHVVAAQRDGDELIFSMPNGLGSFRGKFQRDGAMHGFWFPPGPQGDKYDHATPVVFKSSGKDHWRGDVVPFEDTFTFHLLVTREADGSLSALLRNPERDVGAQRGVSRIVRDSEVVKLLNAKGEVISAGRYDAEEHVLTLPFYSRGGSFDFRRDSDESDFYPRSKHPAAYSYRPPPPRNDGWPVASLNDVGIDRAATERLIQLLIGAPMEQRDTPKVHALLVARHGKLVLEEYFHGFSRDRLHDTRSAAKSMTAVIAGAAMQAGLPVKLSQPVYETMGFPAGDPRKKAMTLEHLLTMSGGFLCDDTVETLPGSEELMLNQTAEPDYYKFTMAVPLATPPGEKAVYCSAMPHLALGVIGKAAGESPLYLFDRLVARPMQITHYAYGLDPVGHPYGGGGMQFEARDFMKFGQLMLNGGTWSGKRVVSKAFAARSTSPLYHLRGMGYGYLWWVIDYPYKDRLVRAYYAGGAGGQNITVIPELDLVVTSFGGNYSSPGTHYVTRELISKYLLPAVREEGDAVNAPVVPRETNYQFPVGDTKDGSRFGRTK